jgi:hypothetical protein
MMYKVARVAQWLERWHKDLLILSSQVQIPLWDFITGLSDEPIKTEVLIVSQ